MFRILFLYFRFLAGVGALEGGSEQAESDEEVVSELSESGTGDGGPDNKLSNGSLSTSGSCGSDLTTSTQSLLISWTIGMLPSASFFLPRFKLILPN